MCAQVMQKHREQQGGTLAQRPGMQWAQTGDDDAFSTVIQWLYSRMDDVKAAVRAHAQGASAA